MVKNIYSIQHKTIKKEAEKNGGKYGKMLYKLINNAVYQKPMENLRNRVDLRLNENDYLKRISNPK